MPRFVYWSSRQSFRRWRHVEDGARAADEVESVEQVNWGGRRVSNSEEVSQLGAQFIDFGLNLSHASQLNPELFVDVIEMALDFPRDLGAPTSGCLVLFSRDSCLPRDSSLSPGSCRPTRTAPSLDASRSNWSPDATGTGRTRRTRGTGNASYRRLPFRHGTSIAPSFKNQPTLREVQSALRGLRYGVGDGYRTRDLLSHSQAFCH